MANCNATAECSTFPDNICWLGIRQIEGMGQADDEGCDIGCRPCHDDPMAFFAGEFSVGSRLEGKRWLRGSPGSRLANGRVGDLPSSEYVPGALFEDSRRVPTIAEFEVAPCWTTDGHECFDADTCDCDPEAPIGPNFPPEDPQFCLPNNPIFPQYNILRAIGQVASGVFQDYWLFYGPAWGMAQSPSNDLIRCRHVINHDLDRITLIADDLMTPHLLRFDKCHINPMAVCAGVAPGSVCVTGETQGTHYLGSPAIRNLFHEVEIDSFTCQIHADPNAAWSDQAVIAAKNAVLARVAAGFTGAQFVDPVAFDRLDYGARAGDNGLIHRWRRTWNALGQTPQPCMDLPVAAIYPNCRLKHAGCTVRADLCIKQVIIDLSLIPHWYRNPLHHSGVPRNDIFVHARLRVYVETTMRAYVTGGPCQIVKSWLPEDHPNYGQVVELEVRNPEHALYGPDQGDCRRMPVVGVVGQVYDPANPADHIIYVDGSGREFIPPASVIWEGYRGPATTNSLVAMTYVPEDNTNEGICCKIAEAMKSVLIEGWPYAVRSNPSSPRTIYAGHVRLDFLRNAHLPGRECEGRI